MTNFREEILKKIALTPKGEKRESPKRAKTT